MFSALRRELKTIVVAVVAAAVTASAPAIAHGVHAAFAHNADKVDGKHAVSSKVAPAKAKGKLVAADGTGRFAAKFIPKVGAAVTSDKLAGTPAANYQRDYQGIVTVAKSGGDFTSIQAAIDSVTGATADARYLVYVAPGVYAEQVATKANVDLMGAGMGRTRVSFSVGGQNQALAVAAGTTTSDLSVENPSGYGMSLVQGSVADSVEVDGSTAIRVLDFGALVTDSVVDGSYDGMWMEPASSVIIRDSALEAGFAAIESVGGDITVLRSTLKVVSPLTAGFGISQFNGPIDIVVRDSEISATASSTDYVAAAIVHQQGAGSVEVTGSVLKASGATSPNSVSANTTTPVKIAHSGLVGTVSATSKTCIGAYNGTTFAALSATCT